MKRLLLGLMLALAATGCGKRMDVLLRHPLQVGSVDQPNTIEKNNGWQATLLTLDPESVCFDVAFWVEQAYQPPDGYLQSQALLMNSDGEWYDDATVTEVREPEVTTYMGRVAEQQQQGTIRECVARDRNNYCTREETRPRYVTVYVPAQFFRADSGGQVCFPNQGRVTLQSDRVVFQINRVNFRWGLEDQTAPTAGGEEEQS